MQQSGLVQESSPAPGGPSAFVEFDREQEKSVLEKIAQLRETLESFQSVFSSSPVPAAPLAASKLVSEWKRKDRLLVLVLVGSFKLLFIVLQRIPFEMFARPALKY